MIRPGSVIEQPGLVERCSGRAHVVWGHVVDGGYFENNGSLTAEELLVRLMEAAC
jgi:hypothetical protein